MTFTTLLHQQYIRFLNDLNSKMLIITAFMNMTKKIRRWIRIQISGISDPDLANDTDPIGISNLAFSDNFFILLKIISFTVLSICCFSPILYTFVTSSDMVQYYSSHCGMAPILYGDSCTSCSFVAACLG